jgi:Arc/MetJ-type ribon-helix-helix transcriptional regulator
MDTEPKDVRLPLMVTHREAEAIDGWRYTNRVPTRAEAIRRLIGTGLQASVGAASPDALRAAEAEVEAQQRRVAELQAEIETLRAAAIGQATEITALRARVTELLVEVKAQAAQIETLQTAAAQQAAPSIASPTAEGLAGAAPSPTDQPGAEVAPRVEAHAGTTVQAAPAPLVASSTTPEPEGAPLQQAEASEPVQAGAVPEQQTTPPPAEPDLFAADTAAPVQAKPATGKRPYHRLTDDNRAEVLRLHEAGQKGTEIAKATCIPRATVSRIIRGSKAATAGAEAE